MGRTLSLIMSEWKNELVSRDLGLPMGMLVPSYISKLTVNPIIVSSFCSYHARARRDSDIIYRRTQQLLHELNLSSDSATEADVRLFCKHSHDLHVVRGSSIDDEYHGKNQKLHDLCECPSYFGLFG